MEEQNLTEIRRTNQRGGRCLSIVDLVEDNTISPEAAGLGWTLLDMGDSFLTGAVPGGAGKTTLMAAFLNLLPPGEEIVTAADKESIDGARIRSEKSPVCLLAHEIGQGPYYAYIWGEAARRFFGFCGENRRTATCLHADYPEQTDGILQECGVSQEGRQAIGFHLYIRAFGGIRSEHRVTSFFCRLNGELESVYEWREDSDTLERVRERKEIANALSSRPEDMLGRWSKHTQEIERMSADGVVDMREVRSRVLEAY
ncbi:MAG: hypothetical protein ACOCSQ_02445 [Planctomycetota bacterium]